MLAKSSVWLSRDPIESNPAPSDDTHEMSDYIAFWGRKPTLHNNEVGTVFEIEVSSPDSEDCPYLGSFTLEEVEKFFGVTLESGQCLEFELDARFLPSGDTDDQGRLC